MTDFNFSTVCLSSTCAQCGPVSYACSPILETPLAPDPTNTVQTLSSSDSNLHLSECAPVEFQSLRHDPKCIRPASSDEFQASVLIKRVVQAPGYRFVV